VVLELVEVIGAVPRLAGPLTSATGRLVPVATPPTRLDPPTVEVPAFPDPLAPFPFPSLSNANSLSFSLFFALVRSPKAGLLRVAPVRRPEPLVVLATADEEAVVEDGLTGGSAAEEVAARVVFVVGALEPASDEAAAADLVRGGTTRLACVARMKFRTVNEKMVSC